MGAGFTLTRLQFLQNAENFLVVGVHKYISCIGKHVLENNPTKVVSITVRGATACIEKSFFTVTHAELFPAKKLF